MGVFFEVRYPLLNRVWLWFPFLAILFGILGVRKRYWIALIGLILGSIEAALLLLFLYLASLYEFQTLGYAAQPCWMVTPVDHATG